jgi:hypothetical protein
MSYPRDPSTNTAIAQYYVAIDAIKAYLHENPPKPGEKTLLDYYSDFGITLYPQLMRAVTRRNFDLAHISDTRT